MEQLVLTRLAPNLFPHPYYNKSICKLKTNFTPPFPNFFDEIGFGQVYVLTFFYLYMSVDGKAIMSR